MALLGDQRRREGQRLAGEARVDAVLPAVQEQVVAARRWMRALARRHLDRRHPAEVATVDDVRQALQRMDRVLAIGCPVRGALEQALLGIDVQRRDRTSTRLNSSHYCAARIPSSA